MNILYINSNSDAQYIYIYKDQTHRLIKLSARRLFSTYRVVGLEGQNLLSISPTSFR